MRVARALAACAWLLLAACTPAAPTNTTTESQPQAANTPSEAPAALAPATAATSGAAVEAPSPSTAPVRDSAADSAPPLADAPGAAPAAPSLACSSDADCAVKDVGSCCGYRPACVNAGAETFPEQVKARCAAEGRMGICGFAPVSGCQCVEGQCAARSEAIGPASPRPLQ